jgi:exosortase B
MSSDQSQVRQAALMQRLGHYLPGLVVGLALGVLYLPTVISLANTLWLRDDQSQGPIVLAVFLWLCWNRRQHLSIQAVRHVFTPVDWALLIFGLLAYVIGRSQGIWLLEVGSSLPVLVAVTRLLCGPGAVRALAFPLIFLIFLIPLPGAVVDAITQPMKLAVSYAAEGLMRSFDYPVSRTGVILQVGPYQLLVADACAGLHTLFTLEAMGLLYLNVIRHTSLLRNIVLALLIIPIGFAANVTRVIVLCLVTFHFGDAAGQGFLHSFAGLVLFLTALVLIVITDAALRRLVPLKVAELRGSK